jgi:hypothetical protein
MAEGKLPSKSTDDIPGAGQSGKHEDHEVQVQIEGILSYKERKKKEDQGDKRAIYPWLPGRPEFVGDHHFIPISSAPTMPIKPEGRIRRTIRKIMKEMTSFREGSI